MKKKHISLYISSYFLVPNADKRLNAKYGLLHQNLRQCKMTRKQSLKEKKQLSSFLEVLVWSLKHDKSSP